MDQQNSKIKAVKATYENMASHRESRLNQSGLNAFKYNHWLREKMIMCFLKPLGYDQVIDIGTGTGVWAEILSAKCNHVDGVDFAENNLRIAEARALDNNILNITYVQCDAQTLESVKPKLYDLALSISVLQHLPDQRVALNSIYSALKDGGRLVLMVHNQSCLFNIALYRAKRNMTQIAINNYNSLWEIESLLNDSGFKIIKSGFCWIFLTDFVFELFRKWYFRPIGCAILLFLYPLERAFNRVGIMNRFYREIFILAEKTSGECLLSR